VIAVATVLPTTPSSVSETLAVPLLFELDVLMVELGRAGRGGGGRFFSFVGACAEAEDADATSADAEDVGRSARAGEPALRPTADVESVRRSGRLGRSVREPPPLCAEEMHEAAGETCDTEATEALGEVPAADEGDEAEEAVGEGRRALCGVLEMHSSGMDSPY
jgi:hypothetical protein